MYDDPRFAEANEAREAMRKKTGGDKCPRCGQVWNVNGATYIGGTVITEGVFIKIRKPGWICRNCRYEWKQKKI